MTQTSRRLPPTPAGGWDWRVHAACRSVDPSTFYQSDNERGPARTRRESDAKAVCAACPVIQECLRWALAAREVHGIWGGLTGEERHALLDHSDEARSPRPCG